jgi:hypothetical protein
MDLLKQSSESLAGRVAYVDLGPITIPEALEHDPTSLDQLWVRGGFPESFLAGDDAAGLDWRLNFVRTYLERDLQQFAGGVSPATVGRLWTMLAHSQGGLFNASRFAAALEVSARTIGRYVEVLEGLLLARVLRPWRANVGKRIVAAPKIYLRDSGIVHALLNIGTREALYGHPVLGASWEGLVIETILAAAPPRAQPFFYRTSAGAEIDLVLELSPGRLAAFEIKRGVPTAEQRARFHKACVDLNAAHRFMVFQGPEGFAMANNIRAVAVSEASQIAAGLS